MATKAIAEDSAVHRLTTASLYASVREYLQELAESGVEGVPPEDPGQGAWVKGQQSGEARRVEEANGLVLP